MHASVIVSTYENPDALALSLAGLARQSTEDFEILIADDGSGTPTRVVVETFARASPVAVHHVRQSDRGLRKGRIVNKALERATGHWIIFLDGDIVVSPDFVAAHLRFARPARYLSGSTVLLSPATTRALGPHDVTAGALDGLRSWRPGHRRSRRIGAAHVPGLAHLLDRWPSRRPVGFHGGNASVARSAALAVGGFDERLERFEDKDFGHRLRLYGLTGESVRYRIPAWHLHHERPYANRAVRNASRVLFEENVARGQVRTQHGLPTSRSRERDPDRRGPCRTT